jgi:hypothetical protein
VDQNKTANSLVSVVVYMADNNTAPVTMAGNGDSEYTGIVYAPKQSLTIGGTSGVNPTYNTQLIGYYVKVHGGTGININYQVSPNNSKAPTMDMTE